MIQVSPDEMEIIINIIQKHAKNCKVLIFGSRLKGNNKKFSDLDLAFICNEGLGLKRRINLDIKFEESDLPYKVDVVDYNEASKEFKKIIDEKNKKIWDNSG
ncbi:nucleotidyltransferase family protein [Methanobrevibacter filiformis]|uniref:protein adenylyltransferase n=1 Tax=Methanobrevibacter filiformis TaxID=55758 RepID=A0A166C7V8_9EURY|nr:nucleotidyltransferase domain-containing protein [Methanobrevibacter filiformis]KZX14221.1 nucleotidyltransferase domain protein [Methanobrevibacter filiformis]